MTLSLAELARRREALVRRSAAQRDALGAALGRARGAATAPVLLGAGGLVALVTASPRLRAWLVRAWALYTLARSFRA